MLCEVLNVTQSCILVCKLGHPNDKYPIPKTKQKIDIKGASYSILRSQFPVQLSYAVTVHRVQGLTVDKAIVLLNNNFFASGQAYVALSRVRNLQDLVLWDYDPNAIKLVPYYNDLLKWCDSVDVIRVPPYNGNPVQYPNREINSVSSEDKQYLLVDELLDYDVMASSPSDTNFVTKQCTKHDLVNSKLDTVKTQLNDKKTGKKRIRSTINKPSGKLKYNKKIPIDIDCEIINTEGVRGPIRTEWPEYRYHQIDETWQRNACSRMGLQFREAFKCQNGGTNVILTSPNLATLHNVDGDGNCLFRTFSYVITGSEQQHIEVRNALVSYMLSIENCLVGYGEDGNYNYLQPFGHTTVQNYIDSHGMNRPGTWGSELEMICLSHMLNTVVYSFGARNNNWEVFAYNFIDRSLTCDYTQKSIYLWFSDSHFKVVTSVM